MAGFFGGDSGLSQDDLDMKRRMAMALAQGVGAPANNIPEGISAIAKALIARKMFGDISDTQKKWTSEADSAWSRLAAGLNQPAASPDPVVSRETQGEQAPAPVVNRFGSGPKPYAQRQASASLGASGGVSGKAKALLDAIASTESPDYNVIYGGRRINDLSRHPGIAVPIKSGPNKGKTSSAAGRYQFLGKTWAEYQRKLGLRDFSPKSQDAAALALASDVYRQKTGGDLMKALNSNDPKTYAKIGRALAGTWTSLPGGIEQGQGSNRFVRQLMMAGGGGPDVSGMMALPIASGAGMDTMTGGAGADMLDAPVPQPMPQPAPQQTEFQRMMALSAEKQGGYIPQQAMGGQTGGGILSSLGLGGAQEAPQPDLSEVVYNPETLQKAPVAAPQPQQMASGDGPSIADLMQFLAMPGASEEQKAVARMMLEQKVQAQDPERAARMEKLKLELEALKNPGAQFENVGGRLVRKNRDGTATEVYAPPSDPMADIKRKQAELDYQQDLNPPVDPMKELDRRKKELEIRDLENPKPKVTDDIAELQTINAERAAKGKPPLGLEEFLAGKKNGGLSITTNPDGTFSVQQGGSGGTILPKITEGQSKDLNYYTRAAGINPKLTEVDSHLASLKGNIAASSGVLGNYFKSPEYQRAEQMGREFMSAILRKDTGAAVTEPEMALYGRMYLPQPGDDKATIELKRESRERALEGLRKGLGLDAIVAETRSFQEGKAPGPDAGKDLGLEDVERKVLEQAGPNPANKRIPAGYEDDWEWMDEKDRARVLELEGGK